MVCLGFKPGAIVDEDKTTEQWWPPDAAFFNFV